MSESDISAFPSPGESLCIPNNSCWPPAIKTNSELIRKARVRRQLIGSLLSIFRKYPNATTDLCGHFDPDSLLTDVYTDLTELLIGSDCFRLALYLPFELLPCTAGDAIQKRFIETYLNCWHELLCHADVRANFVDGDVPEIEIRGELARVIKAAHLLPKLVERGLIGTESAQLIAEKYPQTMLAEGLSHALIYVSTEPCAAQPIPLATPTVSVLNEIRALDVPQHLPHARRMWLHKNHIRRITDASARNLALATHKGWEKSLLMTELQDLHLVSTGIKAIGLRLEHVARTDVHRAQTMFTEARSVFERHIANAEFGEIVDSFLHRLYVCGVIDADMLAKFGQRPRSLESSFASFSAENPDDLRKGIRLVQLLHDPSLSTLLYPVVILFGSRVKGYDAKLSDLDIALFVRPDTAFDRRLELQQQLAPLPAERNIHGKALEFWLERNSNDLAVRDFENPDTRLGDSTLAHVLFGGIWCGDRQSSEFLHEKLLAPYLFEVNGRKRKLWQREIERDTLLYRLCHSGYARHFPPQGGMCREHGAELDADSMFWDSGYRRLATKLFIRKVFLPQLRH